MPRGKHPVHNDTAKKTKCFVCEVRPYHLPTDGVEQIGRACFVRHCDRASRIAAEKTLGYAHQHMLGRTIASNLNVRYYKGMWRGRAAVFLRQGIEVLVFQDET